MFSFIACMPPMARRISRWMLLVGFSGLVGATVALIYAYSIVMACRDFSGGSMCVVGKMYQRASQMIIKVIPPSCSEEKSLKYLSQMVKNYLDNNVF